MNTLRNKLKKLPAARGLNENTNGLIRQYLKKGSSFSEIDNSALESIMNELNNRPRKSLGFMTPNEIFNLKTKF